MANIFYQYKKAEQLPSKNALLKLGELDLTLLDEDN